jgi:endonuclease/exonuclease/phosphatase family metal-dependent hydrolase
VLPDHDSLVLGGDFNFEPKSENYLEIIKHLRDGLKELSLEPDLTFPADHPDRRIDYIFIGEDIEVIKATRFQHPEITAASDHQPQILHFR